MSEQVDVAKKFAFPTANLVATFLFIDIVFLIRHQSSPSFISVSEILPKLSLDLVYLSAALALIALPISIIIIPAAIGANVLASKILTKPFRSFRAGRVMARFFRRGKVSTDTVLRILNTRNDEEMLKKLTDREKKIAKPTHLKPLFILIMLLILPWVSSWQQPDFLMKICSFEAPVEPCLGYFIIYWAAIIQAFLLMALYGYTFLGLLWTKPSDYGVSFKEIRDAEAQQSGSHDFNNAMKYWMRGPRKEP